MSKGKMRMERRNTSKTRNRHIRDLVTGDPLCNTSDPTFEEWGYAATCKTCKTMKDKINKKPKSKNMFGHHYCGTEFRPACYRTKRHAVDDGGNEFTVPHYYYCTTCKIMVERPMIKRRNVV